MFRQELNEEKLKVDNNNAESSQLIKADINTWQACPKKAKICKNK